MLSPGGGALPRSSPSSPASPRNRSITLLKAWTSPAGKHRPRRPIRSRGAPRSETTTEVIDLATDAVHRSKAQDAKAMHRVFREAGRVSIRFPRRLTLAPRQDGYANIVVGLGTRQPFDVCLDATVRLRRERVQDMQDVKIVRGAHLEAGHLAKAILSEQRTEGGVRCPVAITTESRRRDIRSTKKTGRSQRLRPVRGEIPELMLRVPARRSSVTGASGREGSSSRWTGSGAPRAGLAPARGSRSLSGACRDRAG